MSAAGFDKPPFDHRGSFQTKIFAWKGALTPEQTAEVTAAKQIKAFPPTFSIDTFRSQQG